MDKDMIKALEADGEKLRQLTGEYHGPYEADEIFECDACGTMSADCHTQMTYCGEGTFCPTCLAMDMDD